MRAEAEALWAAAPRVVGMTEEGTVRLTARALAPLGRHVEAVLQGLGALGGYASGHEEPDLSAMARRAAELGAELDFVRRAEASDHVYRAEGRGRGLFLRAAPISVAEAMRERLYGAVDTVIFTSATLRAGNSFEYFCRQVGLLDAEGEAVAPLTQLAVPSSFDYATQSALYLPAGLPEPREPGFAEAVAEEVSRLVEVTGARAFVLFTSLRNMERVHSLLSGRLPYPMLLQGEAPKPVLLDAFQSTPSVLFASASFWEGVDVPGDALSLVVLDKLPFASPTHPVVAARIEALEEAGREPFSSYQLPEAALALRQGFGRLIRTRTDRGIVALLDVRIGRKAYGRQLLAGLPPARRFKEIGPLADWFRSGRRDCRRLPAVLERHEGGSRHLVTDTSLPASCFVEVLRRGARHLVYGQSRCRPRYSVAVPDTSLRAVEVPSRCQTPRYRRGPAREVLPARCQAPRYGRLVTGAAAGSRLGQEPGPGLADLLLDGSRRRARVRRPAQEAAHPCRFATPACCFRSSSPRAPPPRLRLHPPHRRGAKPQPRPRTRWSAPCPRDSTPPHSTSR